MHLATSAGALMSTPAALLAARSGSIPWNDSLAEPAARLLGSVAADEADELTACVALEAGRRLQAFLAGIRAYRSHPYRREEPRAAVLQVQGSTRLLDYGGGRPVLLVPSLINRAHILDLRPGASFCQWLRRHGLRPLLLDWGSPGEPERGFDLESYVERRLACAIDMAAALAGGPCRSSVTAWGACWP